MGEDWSGKNRLQHHRQKGLTLQLHELQKEAQELLSMPTGCFLMDQALHCIKKLLLASMTSLWTHQETKFLGYECNLHLGSKQEVCEIPDGLFSATGMTKSVMEKNKSSAKTLRDTKVTTPCVNHRMNTT